jgi:hypothetical protein
MTVAIWALVAVVALDAGIYLSAYLPFFAQGRPVVLNQQPGSSPPPEVAAKFEQLHDLPPEEMVRRASVITLSRHEVEGNKGTCRLTEILKQSPGTKLYYEVGDEVRHCSFDPTDGSMHGEGQVTFFVGSPAEMRYSTTYFGDRISGLGDMPLSELRALIAAGQGAAGEAPHDN